MTFEPALSDQTEADTSEIPPILAWIETHRGPAPAAQPPATGSNARAAICRRAATSWLHYCGNAPR